jgi:hypothetical protein
VEVFAYELVEEETPQVVPFLPSGSYNNLRVVTAPETSGFINGRLVERDADLLMSSELAVLAVVDDVAPHVVAVDQAKTDHRNLLREHRLHVHVRCKTAVAHLQCYYHWEALHPFPEVQRAALVVH